MLVLLTDACKGFGNAKGKGFAKGKLVCNGILRSRFMAVFGDASRGARVYPCSSQEEWNPSGAKPAHLDAVLDELEALLDEKTVVVGIYTI